MAARGPMAAATAAVSVTAHGQAAVPSAAATAAATPSAVVLRDWRRVAQRTVRLALTATRTAWSGFNDASEQGHAALAALADTLILLVSFLTGAGWVWKHCSRHPRRGAGRKKGICLTCAEVVDAVQATDQTLFTPSTVLPDKLLMFEHLLSYCKTHLSHMICACAGSAAGYGAGGPAGRGGAASGSCPEAGGPPLGAVAPAGGCLRRHGCMRAGEGQG